MAVRRERVILELQDNFSTGMARAAAATALLDKELDGLSKEAVQSSRATRSVERDVDGLGKTARRTEKDIDRLSGRIRILADVVAILGPTIAPVGAVTAAALGGIASQLGFAVAGAGTAVLAFQGVGDALKALNKADLEPTADNLEEARIQLERLSPAARSFVKELSALKPQMKELRDLAATGLFPGLERGLEGLEDAWPRVERIISAISTELGDIGGDAGESLGSERWAPFLDFLAEEGPSALRDFATATGNTAHALANLWMATDPLNDGFSSWLVEATADLDRWTEGLSQTEGFQEFLAYVDETGPQVAATLGALANAALQIVEAAAPLGGPILRGLEAAANVIAAIADSDLGAPIMAGVTALALFNRTMAVTEALSKRTSGNVGTIAARSKSITLGGLGRGAAFAGGAAIAGTGVLDGFGVSNTASLALIGSVIPGYGTAAGAAVGAVLDLAHANDDLEASLKRVDRAIVDNNITDYTAGINDLKSKLNDIQNTSGVGDYFSDLGSSIANNFSNPINTLTFGDSQGQTLEKQIAAKEAAMAAAEAQARLAEESARAAAAQGLLSSGLTSTSAGLNTATASADEFSKSLMRANDILAGRSAAVNYEAAIDDFTKSLKENGRTLDINTEKGRANRTALDNIASTALEFADTLTGIDRTKFLDKARDQFIRAQVEAGKTRREAKRLADQIGLLNQVKGVPTIDLNTDPAEASLQRFLAQARRNRIVLPVVTSSTNANLADQAANSGVKKAFGGLVRGPGGPRDDLIPARLSNLEYVMPADAVSHYGVDTMDAMRAKKLASGGLVGGGGGLKNFVTNDLDMKYPSTLKQWNAALAASTKLLETEKTKRQALLDQADSVRSSIRSGYRSDLFGDSGSSVWMSAADRAKAGTGDVFSTLTGDLTNLNALKSATAQLQKKGLDGAALADLLSNASLQQVQAFASGSAADVLRYESLYNQREKALVGAGNFGASAAYGPALKAATAQVAATAAFTKAIDRLDGRVDGVVKALKAVGPRRPGRG